MSNFFETVGEIAAPLKPAFDFLGPQQVQSDDPGSILNTLDTGLGNMLAESPLALLNGAVQAVTGEGSARDRLMLGAMMAVGGTMAAKRAHRMWRDTALPNLRPPTPDIMPARATSGWQTLEEFGERARFLINDDPAAEALALSRPGLKPRQIQMLSAQDEYGVVKGFRRWNEDDLANDSAGKALVKNFAEGEDLAAAQLTFARFDFAVDSGRIGGPQNADIRKMWRQVTENPSELMKDPAKVEELFVKMRSFADATDGLVTDDLAVGFAGRVENIRWDPDGNVEVQISHPSDWGDGRITDPAVRTQRLQALNYRALAPQGYKNLKQLLDLAINDRKFLEENPNARSFFSRTLADGTETGGLQLGADWYPQALEDVKKVFGFDDATDPEEISRAIAAVSFLSEAEDWSTNIAKAKTVFEKIGDVNDGDFQAFLRDGVEMPDGAGRYEYTGTKKAKAAHKKRFDEIHDQITSGGLPVKTKELQKVLRLWGNAESVQDVFRTTKGSKQRNFFLNIRYPDLENPVTIDRHAFDAFLGLDSGVTKRPIDMMVDAGEQAYDVIGDTYRALAAEYNMKPHQIQAIVWEAWREMKLDSPRAGWTRGHGGDPFMILDNDGRNLAYEALNGRGFLPAHLEAGAGPIPLTALSATSSKGLSSTALPDGRVALATDTSDLTATVLRTMTPGVIGADGVPRWTASRPARYHNYESHIDQIRSTTAPIETYALTDLARNGGHPALRPGTTITFTVRDGATVRVPRMKGSGARINEIGRTTIDEQKLNPERLGIEDLDADNFMGPESPLYKGGVNEHQFAVISAELTEGQVQRLTDSPRVPDSVYDYKTSKQAHNALGRKLRKEGYKPIEVEGRPGVDELGNPVSERSWLVIGMDPKRGLEIGEDFGQDSILTNDGFLYHRTDPNDPSLAGLGQPTQGVGFMTDAENYRTELTIGDRKVQFASDINFDDTIDQDLTGRKQRNLRRVEMTLNDTADVAAMAAELEARGMTDLSIYAPTAHLDGWQRAYEEVASDGSTMTVARYRTGATGSAHGSHVFVRDNSAYPAAPKVAPGEPSAGPGRVTFGNGLQMDLQFQGVDLEMGKGGLFDLKLDGSQPLAFGYLDGRLTPIFDELEIGAGRYDATLYKNGTIVPSAMDDVTPAIRAAQDIKPNWNYKATLRLKTDDGTFNFPPESKIGRPTETVKLANGMRSPLPKVDRPLTDHAATYGFDFDVGYRINGEAHVLGDQVQRDITLVTAQFTGDHDAVVKRTRFDGVTVSDAPDDDILAYFEDRAGGKIVLAKQWWSNPEALGAQLTGDRNAGVLSRRVPPTPEFVVAHEYGHVLYKALEMSEGKKSLDFVKGMNAIIGGKRWGQRVSSEISTTAALNHSELLAEVYSEVLANNPSKLSTELYSYVQELLDHRLRFIGRAS